MNQIKILDIPFKTATKKEVIEQIDQWLTSSRQHQIATPNPEILLKTITNQSYKQLLQATDLNTADGIGILWAATYLSKITNKTTKPKKWIKAISLLITTVIYPKYCQKILPERVTGSDLIKDIFIKYSQNPKAKKAKIFLLGAAPNIAEKVKSIYTLKHKDINIVGTHSGSPNPNEEEEIISLINSKDPNILFVAFGAPKQEQWIKRNLYKMPSVKIAIGVGGAFDFLAGKYKRAPLWMRKIGLEWLFRLIQQPSRIKRIYNATIKFPLTIIKKN